MDMRTLLYPLLVFFFCSCNGAETNNTAMQQKIDSLEKRLETTYKPGLGEFMSAIQAHHAKLWYSGNAGNWPLALFEIKELGEIVEDIKTYEKDRVETAKIDQLQPYLDSVLSSISSKDNPAFRKSYIALTAACNNCHKATSFEFNVVQVPTGNPFPNQDFSVPASGK